MDLYTVSQLMPAEPGWLAVYRDGETGELFTDPVMAWGVADVWTPTGRGYPDGWRRLEGPIGRAVVGLVMTETGPDVAEHVANLTGYMRAGESPEQQPWWEPPPQQVDR